VLQSHAEKNLMVMLSCLIGQVCPSLVRTMTTAMQVALKNIITIFNEEFQAEGAASKKKKNTLLGLRLQRSSGTLKKFIDAKHKGSPTKSDTMLGMLRIPARCEADNVEKLSWLPDKLVLPAELGTFGSAWLYGALSCSFREGNHQDLLPGCASLYVGAAGFQVIGVISLAACDSESLPLNSPIASMEQNWDTEAAMKFLIKNVKYCTLKQQDVLYVPFCSS
jgi:hypothetical protein